MKITFNDELPAVANLVFIVMNPNFLAIASSEKYPQLEKRKEGQRDGQRTDGRRMVSDGVFSV